MLCDFSHVGSKGGGNVCRRKEEARRHVVMQLNIRVTLPTTAIVDEPKKVLRVD